MSRNDLRAAGSNHAIKGLKARRKMQHHIPDQGSKNHKQGKRQERERAYKHKGDGFDPQLPPRPRVSGVISAVERNANGLDAFRRKKNGKRNANCQETTPGLR